MKQSLPNPRRRKTSAPSPLQATGYIVGQTLFGILVDRWSRKNSLLVVTVLLIVFSALSAGSYGVGASGIFAALTAWRFLGWNCLGRRKAYRDNHCGRVGTRASSRIPEQVVYP